MTEEEIIRKIINNIDVSISVEEIYPADYGETSNYSKIEVALMYDGKVISTSSDTIRWITKSLGE